MSAFGTSRLLPAWAVCDERMEGSRSVAPSSPHGLRRTQKYSLRPHGSDGIHISSRSFFPRREKRSSILHALVDSPPELSPSALTAFNGTGTWLSRTPRSIELGYLRGSQKGTAPQDQASAPLHKTSIILTNISFRRLHSRYRRAPSFPSLR